MVTLISTQQHSDFGNIILTRPPPRQPFLSEMKTTYSKQVQATLSETSLHNSLKSPPRAVWGPGDPGGLNVP